LYGRIQVYSPCFWWGTRKGMRPGTEAVHQIAGMAKALELSYDNLEEERV
jgi:cysteine desulfurase